MKYKIRKIEFRAARLPRTEPFRIAYQTSYDEPVLYLRLRASGGAEGWGASAPSIATSETFKSIAWATGWLAKRLAGKAFEEPADVWTVMGRMMERNSGAKAGIDIAVWDLLAREAGLPLHKFLGGGKRKKIATDMSIGIMGQKETVARAKKFQREGFRALKLKVGLGLAGDIRRVQAVREAVGPHMALRVDANQGYSWQEAVKLARAIEPLDIELIEQPVKAGDLRALKKVTDASPLPIMADEAVHCAADAERALSRRCADMLNIKLMKSSGITGALQIAQVARKHQAPLMIGCMGESRVSCSAGMHFAISEPLVHYADLDSWMSVLRDWASGCMQFENGYIRPLDGALGIGCAMKTWKRSASGKARSKARA